jgi:hypothetical protein
VGPVAADSDDAVGSDEAAIGAAGVVESAEAADRATLAPLAIPAGFIVLIGGAG